MRELRTPDDDIDAELNLLGKIDKAFYKLNSEQRLRTLKWVKSKYSKEWPSDSY